MSHRSLIVLPDDTAKPILDAVGGVQKSLRVKMFVFSDPALIPAVIDAHKRGVTPARASVGSAARFRGDGGSRTCRAAGERARRGASRRNRESFWPVRAKGEVRAERRLALTAGTYKAL